MTSESEDILNRYRVTEIAEDTLGRVFTIGRLKLSQQAGIYELVDKPVNRAIFLVAASVRKTMINNVEGVWTVPKTLGEVNTMLDLLDNEGFVAVSKAYRKLNGVEEPEETGVSG